LFWAGGSEDLGRADKPVLARRLIERIAGFYAKRKPKAARRSAK